MDDYKPQGSNRLEQRMVRYRLKLKKELKPCPFCGCPVKEAEGIGGLLFFACTNYAGCGAMISFDQKVANEHPEKAIDMYNRRA